MQFFKFLKQKIILIICFFFCFFWIGFFSTEFIHNLNYCYYRLEFSSSIIQKEAINADFFLTALQKYKKDDAGNYILDTNGDKIPDGYSYASVKPQTFFDKEDIFIEKNDDNVLIAIKARYFVNAQGATLSKDSKDRYEKVLNKVLKFYDKDVSITYLPSESYYNGVVYGFVSLGIGSALFILGFVGVYFYLKKKDYVFDTLDSKQGFSIFGLTYWKNALKLFRKPRVFDLCLIAILFSLALISKLFAIPSGFANLNIGISYLFLALICFIYGPFWGLVIGFSSDVLGFFIFPSSGFFYFGYTIQAMLACLCYAFCFFGSKISFTRCLVSRILVNFLLNAILGTILWKHVGALNWKATFDFFLYISLPKNVLFLIPQAFLLFLFLRGVEPVLKARGILKNESEE